MSLGFAEPNKNLSHSKKGSKEQILGVEKGLKPCSSCLQCDMESRALVCNNHQTATPNSISHKTPMELGL